MDGKVRVQAAGRGWYDAGGGGGGGARGAFFWGLGVQGRIEGSGDRLCKDM